MSLLKKYNVLLEMFGIQAITLENITQTERERKVKVQALKDDFHIIEDDDYERLNFII